MAAPMTPASAPAPGRRAPLLELFAVERRSLAAFRIGLGGVLLWDLYGRAQTLREHYTAEGVFPRASALELRPDSPLVRVFLWSDEPGTQALLFALFALCALALLLGYRTRLAALACFLFLVALVRRNPYVCHTGDTWLKALCFWGTLLPLGSCWSVDRLRGRVTPDEDRAPRVLSLASAGVLLQVLVFYVSAGYLKSRYDVWRDGDAVWVFTHALEYTRPFGAWLGHFPGLCRFLTWATLALEGLAPFLFFSPFATRRVRGALVLVFAAFHLTLWSVIHIGLFQLTCLVALTLFVPGPAWDAAGARLARSPVARWSAALRARFGREPRARFPALERLARRGAALAAAAALPVILVSNVNTALEDPYARGARDPIPLPAPVDAYGRMFSLVQNWNMFTDIGRLFFGWFLVLGQLDDGTVVDVLAHRPFTRIERPPDYSAHFPNHNTRRYWREIALPGQDFLLAPLTEHLAREWERAGGAPLAHLAILQIGRVPLERPAEDRVKRICIWGRPPASEGEKVPLLELRERWQAFLAGLPKSVPATPVAGDG